MAFGFGKEEIVVSSTPSEIQRFSMLICGMFCSICVGAAYAFSLISDKLTNDYHFDQKDITTISTVGIVFGYFGIPYAILYDYFGPKIVVLLGIIVYAIGLLFFALIFLDKIGHSVAGLAAINGIVYVGSTLFDMASILSVLSWFPLDRGLVVACVKTITGLGGSVVATIYNAFFQGRHSDYMFFLMGFVTLVGMTALVVIYLPPYHMTGYRLKTYTENEHSLSQKVFQVYLQRRAPARRFIVVFVIVSSLLIVIMTQSVVFVFIENPTLKQRRIPAILMILLCLLLPFTLLPFKFWSGKSTGRTEDSSLDEKNSDHHGSHPPLVEEEKEEEKSFLDREREQPSPKHQSLTSYEECSPRVEKPITNSEDDTSDFLTCEEKLAPQYLTGFTTNACRPLLWCMWINGFCVSGASHVILLNIRQIYVAISEDPDDVLRPALYITLTSIGSALGRLAVSFFEVVTQSKPSDKRIPFTTVYCAPACLQMISCILLLTVPHKALLVPMLLSGIGYGAYAASAVLTAQTIFSVDVAKHYNSIFIGDILAVIAMNRFLFGELMTRNSTKNINGAPLCLGRDKCIRTSFIVLACTCALGLVASILMHVIYRRYAVSVHRVRAEKRAALLSNSAEPKGHSKQE